MTPSHPAELPDRRQLQGIIAGLSEGVVLIEPDGRFVWANEAALTAHGASAPSELGDSVDRYAERYCLSWRDGRRLAVADYPAARLLRGEGFHDLVVAVMKRGEPDHDRVHRCRGFVLNDADGRPDVLVLVLSDATEAFEAEERFERMFNANPAPALITRVSDLRHVRVNSGFLELTGWRAEDIVGKSLYELDILDGAEQREICKARLSGWRTVPQLQADLSLPDGTRRLVLLAGQPIEISDTRCMLFTFADLEPRRRAERALKQSEERFAKAFRLAPAPMTVMALKDFRFVHVNHAFLQLTGWAVEEVVGRRPEDIELWESAETRRQVEGRLVRSGAFRALELRLKTRAAALVDCLVSAETVTIGEEPCVLMVLQDITDRRRSESELVSAIEAALGDGRWLSRNIMDKLATLRAVGGEPRAFANVSLTTREQEVLNALCRGLSDEEIADRYALTRNTVRNHVARIYRKTGAHSRAEAVVWARDRGFGSPT